jgi:hypothetical protein
MFHSSALTQELLEAFHEQLTFFVQNVIPYVVVNNMAINNMVKWKSSTAKNAPNPMSPTSGPRCIVLKIDHNGNSVAIDVRCRG